MLNQIERDAYVLQSRVKAPIEYVRMSNAIPIVLHFRDYGIPNGATAEVYVQKPSGKAVFDNASIAGNDVTVTVTNQMFAELGLSELQIKLTKGETELVTFVQPVLVRPNYTEGDADQSQNEGGFFDEAKEILEDAQDAIEKVDAALNGTVIPANADLNNYRSPGWYRCEDAATASTLKNCPVSDAGFTMRVAAVKLSETLNSLLQIIHANYAHSTIFMRNIGDAGSSDVFVSEWEQFLSNEAICDDLISEDKTIAGAINENHIHIGNVSTLVTEEKTNLVGALNELAYKADLSFGTMSDLTLAALQLKQGRTYTFYGLSEFTGALTGGEVNSDSTGVFSINGANADFLFFANGDESAIYTSRVATGTGSLLKRDTFTNVDAGNLYALSGGTEIPENADMNTYTEVGNYYCPLSATAATLSHAPFYNAFTLKVVKANGVSYPAQIFKRYGDGEMQYRVYNPDTSSWGNYYSYSDNLSLMEELSFSSLETSNKTIIGAINEIKNTGAGVDTRNLYMLSGGTEIPANANMDTYTEVGNYYCNANTTAATLTNVPFLSAFTLKVILSAGTGYPLQIFRRYNDGVVACRCYTPSASAWGKYYYYNDDNSILSSINTRTYDLQTINKTLPGSINELHAEVDNLIAGRNLMVYEVPEPTVSSDVAYISQWNMKFYKEKGSKLAVITLDATINFKKEYLKLTFDFPDEFTAYGQMAVNVYSTSLRGDPFKHTLASYNKGYAIRNINKYFNALSYLALTITYPTE